MKFFNELILNLFVICIAIGWVLIGLFNNYDVSNGYIINLSAIGGSIFLLTNFIRYNKMGTISYREYGRNITLCCFIVVFIEGIVGLFSIFTLISLILTSYLIFIEFETFRDKITAEVEIEDDE